jgi:hypothetical protein
MTPSPADAVTSSFYFKQDGGLTDAMIVTFEMQPRVPMPIDPMTPIMNR